MALVLKVGDNDEMVPVPKNFPTCHDYMPSDKESDNSMAQNSNGDSTSLPIENGNNTAANRGCYGLSLTLAIFVTLTLNFVRHV